MENIPKLNEWLKENPGKGVNDYFKTFPSANKGKSNAPMPEITPFKGPMNQHQKQKEQDLLVVVFSLVVIIAFFLPWLDTKVQYVKSLVGLAPY